MPPARSDAQSKQPVYRIMPDVLAALRCYSVVEPWRWVLALWMGLASAAKSSNR